MKILVLGAGGMAGHMISDYLNHCGHTVTAYTREHLDIEKSFLLPRGFDFVINCIGVLLPDSEKDMRRTVFINSYFPHYLSAFYHNIPVIHISTDCVFDGGRGMYTEVEMPNERNIYGMSKGLGELNNSKDITLRMSIIGPEIKEEGRSGLFDWMLNKSPKHVTGYTNAKWNGITTLELAKVIEQFIEKPTVNGIHHPISESVTKYELLKLINKVFGLEKIVSPGEGAKTIDKTLDCRKKHFRISPLETQLEELNGWTSLN